MVTKVRLYEPNPMIAGKVVELTAIGRERVAEHLLGWNESFCESIEQQNRVLAAILNSLDQETYECVLRSLGCTVIHDCHR